ncbi:lysine-specific histone demethylase 1b, partial [Plakobranchus ocellatus]
SSSTKFGCQDLSDDDHPKRPCGRSGCPTVAPMCFAGTSERCTGNKYTPRWYHISVGEHYCNECFEYYRGRKGLTGLRDGGLKEYETWKAVWSSKAQRTASITGYLVDQVLPFWARCQNCSKWRQLPPSISVTPQVLGSFTCAVLATWGNKIKHKDKNNACDTPEDKRVQYVCNSGEFFQSRPTPCLRQSLAAQFLTKYYPDGVGLSPTESVQPIPKAERKKLCPFVVPFAKENRPLHALGVTPDMMLDQEIAEFPDMAQNCPQLYLALRNLVLAIWALNPKEWVTKERVEQHIVCRGLARISCVQMLPVLLTFLTRHAFINQGLLRVPESEVVGLRHGQSSVIVIGAGASGLAAAHCLHSHGIKVTVLEAKTSVGGRVSATSSNCEVDTYSGQLLNGCWNNPLAIMAYQLGLNLQPQSDSCPLVTTQGQLVPDDLDRRIEFHYNAILDIVSDWRRGRGVQADLPLIDKFKEFHEEFIRETEGYFSETAFSQEEVRRLVNFYLSNLEFACGCSLDRASSLHWDQNEDLPQLGGPRMWVSGGFGSILKSLAQNLDIRLDCQVTEVNYSDQNIVVHSSQGDFIAEKVIVTVPLAVLQKELIKFHPPLPEFKVKAIQSLGAGKVEKVTMQFSEDFWSEKTENQLLFGHVPESENHMGFFNVFYCHQHKEKNTHILMSHLVGRGLALMDGKSDEEVVDACVKVLQSLFPEKEVPQPVTSTVSHWREDKHTGMAYSYIPVGASGDTYDNMAQCIEGHLHFAGEATHRQFPQTVTGAYISGLREAWNILDDLSLIKLEPV